MYFYAPNLSGMQFYLRARSDTPKVSAIVEKKK